MLHFLVFFLSCLWPKKVRSDKYESSKRRNTVLFNQDVKEQDADSSSLSSERVYLAPGCRIFPSTLHHLKLEARRCFLGRNRALVSGEFRQD